MPAYRGGGNPLFSLKEIVIAPANSERGLDPHQGAVLLHDGVTGEPARSSECLPITEIRTAAVSAVATTLARKGSRVVAVLGSGVQGPLTRGRDADDPRRTWGSGSGAAIRLTPEALALETHSLVATSVEEALDGADIVCTTTTAREPIVRLEWLHRERT